MFRVAVRSVPRLTSLRLASRTSQTVVSSRTVNITKLQTQVRLMSAAVAESDSDFDSRYVSYFDRADIDGWEIRKGMSDLAAMDLVPEPSVVAAALRACRRVNDYSLTTRILEVVKVKCGNKEKEIWPYMLQELRPTLTELGILTPEDLGYNVPELALPNPYNIH